MAEEKPDSTNARTRFSVPVVLGLVVVAAVVGAITSAALQHVQAGADDTRADGPGAAAETAPEDWQAEPVDDPFEALLSDDWDPFQEMQAMHERMEEIFNDSWMRMNRSPLRNFSGAGQRLTTSPSIDLAEHADEYVAIVDMPGLEDGTADVTVEGNQLTISGSRVDVVKDTSGGRIIRQERRATHFARTMTLPGPVDPEGMTTAYENGVLTIRLPKLNTDADSGGESSPS